MFDVNVLSSLVSMATKKAEFSSKIALFEEGGGLVPSTHPTPPLPSSHPPTPEITLMFLYAADVSLFLYFILFAYNLHKFANKRKRQNQLKNRGH